MAGRRNASPDARRGRRKRPRRKAGATTEGVVRAVNSSADAVVDTPLGVVLAPGALPGERLRLEDVRKHGRVQRGEVAEWLSESEDRTQASCPHADGCGGCPLGTATPELERRIKSDLVSRALGAFGEVPAIRWVDAPTREAYRSRARLHFRDHVIGYRGRRGRALVDVSRCEVLVPALGGALEGLRETVAPQLRGGGEIRLSLGAEGRASIMLEAGTLQSPELYAALESLAADARVAGILARIGDSGPAYFGDADACATAADGSTLRMPVGGFAQAQDAVNRALATHVCAMADAHGQRVLELYAGAGNLSVLLAPGAASFESFEIAADAVEAARANFRQRELLGSLKQAEAEACGVGGRVDVLVLDPPRDGALRALGPALGRKPRRVVYVSCQPSTLGRDLRLLQDVGFVPTDVTAFDMFPKTAHLECVVTLERPQA